MHSLSTKMVAFVCGLMLWTPVAFAGPWDGDWNSSYGQLRLLQSGDRVFGDYAERGTIEGNLSADGRNLRGVFVYTDGRWGTFDWVLNGERFAGTWRWNAQGMTAKGDEKWSATKSSARTSFLKFADTGTRAWPPEVPVTGNGELARFLAFNGAAPNPTPQPQFQPAPGPLAQEDFGPWYGGYSLSDLEGGYEIVLNIDQIGDTTSGSADISILLGQSSPDCPQSMHPEFCSELISVSDRLSVTPRITGVLMEKTFPREMFVAFKITGERLPRILRMSREASYIKAGIVHPTRGVDFDGVARAVPHLCEQTACSNQVVNELRRNPLANLGDFANRAFLQNYNPGLDNRAQAHRTNMRPAPRPAPTPARRGLRPQLSDAWTIHDESGEPLGEITFRQQGPSLSATGILKGFFETRQDHETEFRLETATQEAVAFSLTTYAGQSGEQKAGHLMIELPSAARDFPKGTLIVADQVYFVELVARKGAGSNVPQFEPGPDENDLPAIGIYGYPFELHNVPTGRALALRERPDRRAPETGRIRQTSPEFYLTDCQPMIDSLTFEEASIDRRVQLLSASWCQAQLQDGTVGWLPGIYLMPLPKP